MSIFNVLSLLGGLAMFLFGMNVMGDGLERRAGGKLKAILEKLTASPLRGLLLGIGVTAVIQSSSATTVMVVGFVNSGLMKLSQAIGVIMGANIGTTVTSWILSLTGIEGDSLFVKLLKPASFTPILAVIGIAMTMFSNDDKKKDVGTILLGFTVLMFGMETMSSAVKPLANMPEFTQILTYFTNPILGVLAGALLTAVIQSSSASVGILQALSATGKITFSAAVPIILGQNIGTCITAMLSSVGANKNAKRAAFVHLYFNVIGTVIFLAVFLIVKAFIGSALDQLMVNEVAIALVHTAFNVLATALMLPFTKALEKLACLTVKDTEEEPDEQFQLLDERLLNTPPFAVERSRTMTVKMAGMARDALLWTLPLISHYDAEVAEKVVQAENKTDIYEDKLGTYLVKVSALSLSASDSREVSRLLHCIGDFERIGDHALSLMKLAQEVDEKKIVFSKEASEELGVMYRAVSEITEISTKAFEEQDTTLAKEVEPLEQVVDRLKSKLSKRHIDRLQKGECTIEMGFIFSDIITNCERIADHCSNVAASLIELEHDSYDRHEYLNAIKTEDNEEFKKRYEEYKEKYAI